MPVHVVLWRKTQSTVRNQTRLHGCRLEILFTTVMKYIIKMSLYRLFLFPQFPAQFFENRMLRFLTWISASFLYFRVLSSLQKWEKYSKKHSPFARSKKVRNSHFQAVESALLCVFRVFILVLCAFLHPRSSPFSGQNKHAANRSHSTEICM